MEQPVSSRESSPVKQKFRRPQVAQFRYSLNPITSGCVDLVSGVILPTPQYQPELRGNR